jgi:hypothetical protein
MIRDSLRPSAVCVAFALLGACSASGTTNHFTGTTGAGAGVGSGGEGPTGSGGTGTGAGGSAGVGLFDAGTTTGAGGGSATSCATETQFVYTLTADNSLYRFDPPSLTFTLIGVLDCPNTLATPYSMAVDRNATAWSVFTDGSLWHIDTSNAHCTGTTYVAGQSGWTTFGMGFSADMPGGTAETLYVSEAAFTGGTGTTKGLGKIDLTTMTLTPIGMYDKINARAELTGTGDARLFGAFEGSPYDVAQIDKTSAAILSEAMQSTINYPPDSSNFAFAFWGGDFWLFVGPGSSTDVFHYQVATQVTTKVSTVDFEIVGAGVSTCAPIVPPT